MEAVFSQLEVYLKEKIGAVKVIPKTRADLKAYKFTCDGCGLTKTADQAVLLETKPEITITHAAGKSTGVISMKVALVCEECSSKVPASERGR